MSCLDSVWRHGCTCFARMISCNHFFLRLVGVASLLDRVRVDTGGSRSRPLSQLWELERMELSAWKRVIVSSQGITKRRRSSRTKFRQTFAREISPDLRAKVCANRTLHSISRKPDTLLDSARVLVSSQCRDTRHCRTSQCTLHQSHITRAYVTHHTVPP